MGIVRMAGTRVNHALLCDDGAWTLEEYSAKPDSEHRQRIYEAFRDTDEDRHDEGGVRGPAMAEASSSVAVRWVRSAPVQVVLERMGVPETPAEVADFMEAVLAATDELGRARRVGVSYDKGRADADKWRARIGATHLGWFATQDEAALAIIERKADLTESAA